MNPFAYLVLAAWLSGMGILGYVVWNRMQQAAHKRKQDKRLAALAPPLPGTNHHSLPSTTYRLEPAAPPHPTNQARQYAEHQLQQARWKQWQQLSSQPIPEA